MGVSTPRFVLPVTFCSWANFLQIWYLFLKFNVELGKKNSKFVARVTWHIWWVVMVKLDINAHNFWHSSSNSIKVTFLDSSRQNLSRDVYFVCFREGPQFPIVYPLFSVMSSLWRHFLLHDFQICIFCETLNRLSAYKLSML